MTSPADLRALCPAVERNTYLNAAAASPLPRPVYDALTAHYREQLEAGDVHFGRWLVARDRLRERLAVVIGATGPELAFVPSTSYAFQAIARALWDQGVREVVTLSAEFPSTTLPLLAGGLRLRVVPPRADGAFEVEDVAAALTPATGAVVASAVQYGSGFRIDLAGLSALCRDRGVFFGVNAAQALGQLPLDVKALKADFLCAPSHKWLMGGPGVGVLYARADRWSHAAPAWTGWLSVERALDMDNLAGVATRSRDGNVVVAEGPVQTRPFPVSLEAGVGALGLVAGVSAALELLEAVGIAAIEAHNRRLQSLLREGLRRRGFCPNAPDDRVAGICVVPVEGEPLAAVRALLRHGVVLTPRGGGVRISTHVFNDESDVDRLFAALESESIRPRSGVG